MESKAHHLEIGREEIAGNGGLGRYIFLPGSPDRAARIAQRFDEATAVANRRGLSVQLGSIEHEGQRVDVAAVPTGMGCPSLDIIVGELLQLGARRFLRIGTSGSLQSHIRSGDVVVASAAVRDEGTSNAYSPPEFPAVADPVMVELLCVAARRMGLGDRTHCGVVHSKDSFFGREFAVGPRAEANQAYMKLLTDNGILASEMESAHLFVLGAVAMGNGGEGGCGTSASRSRTREVVVRCAAVDAVVSDHQGFTALEEEQAAEERMLDLAVAGMLDLAALECDAS